MFEPKAEPDLVDVEHRMVGALEALRKEFGGLRSGRVSPQLLDSIIVEAYGSQMSLPQVSTITMPEPRLFMISIWDQNIIKNIVKAIQKLPLDLNPQIQGSVIRIVIPELTQQRRHELSKIAVKYAENSRIAVRNIRRDAMDTIKKMEKNSLLSQDEHKKWADEIQRLTDRHIQKINEMVTIKEKEILQV